MSLQFTLAMRYLRGRKLRTVLTTLAIMFGVLVIFGFNTVLPAMLEAFEANALAMAGQTDVTIVDKIGSAFSADVVDKVAAVEGVRAISGSLQRVIGLPANYFDRDPAIPDAASALALVGIDPEGARTVRGYQVRQGRFLEEDDTTAAVIAESLAETAGVSLNGTLSLPTPAGLVDFTVVGILPQRLMPGNEEVLVPLAEAQTLLDAAGQVNVIDANFDTTNEDRRAEILSQIEGTVGPAFTVGALPSGSQLATNLRVGQLIFTLLGVLALLMGGFIIFNTFRTVVAERRRDIGMLRAVGANRRTISGVVLTEGAIQGAIGTALGLIFGYFLGALIVQGMAPMLAQYVNLRISTPAVDPVLVAVAVLLGMGITLLAAWIPARAAARVTPLEALRPPVARISLRRMAGFGFWAGVILIGAAIAALVSGNVGLLALGAVLFTVGLVLVAPALIQPVAALFGKLAALIFARNGTAQLAEGNLSRQPGRAAVTASTTMIALAILLMAATFISSIYAGFEKVLRESLGSDFLLVPPAIALWGTDVGSAPELADELRAVDGVEVVSSLRYAQSLVNDVAVSVLGIRPEDYTRTSGLAFSQGDPEAAYRGMESGRGVLLNGIGATTIGANLGDTITLQTATGEQSYEVVGVATDYLNAKIATAYMSQQNLASDFGVTEDVFLQVNLSPGADKAAAAASFKQMLRMYPQYKLVEGQAYYEENMAIFQVAFLGLYAMMLFLAIPSLIAMVNTLAIGVIERTREIGMLRAVGSTRGQVRTIILAEALILAAIGTALGMLAGLYLGYLGVQAVDAVGYPIFYSFPVSGILAGIAIGLLFGALAAIIPARQASRMDVVAALRYE
jgi:putative ABC transport system permease protein